MASKVWHTELWKSWDKHGRNDFLKLIKHKFKEGNIPEWRRGLYELISNGIQGNIKKDSVVQTLGELTNLDGAISSAIVDILTIFDAEAQNEERNNFYYIVKESEKFLTERILKERLEIETLQDVGTLKNKNFQTKFIKVKTKLYYKQRKFNLFREESEGYSKLIVELNQERQDNEVASTLEIVKSLIGYFNLDPNRVLDILLETFENRPQDDALFIPLIRSYMSDQQVLCEVLGFKYCSTMNATPFSLQKVTALMLQHGVIKLDDILPWLVPDDKAIIADHELAMKQAKEYVRKMSVISTKDKEEVAEEKDNSQEKYASNQKFGLCEALLEIGAWEVAQSLFNRLPDYCFTDQRPIALALCKMSQALVEPVYRKHCILSPKLPGRKVPPLKSSLAPPSMQNLDDIHDHLLPMLIVLGPNLHHDPILMYKVMRLCNAALRPLDENSQPLNKNSRLYCDVITILDVALLPSLSFMDCNCCVAEELWNILKCYPYQNRYSLYARWKNETPMQHAALLRKRADAQKKIKSIMKRVSKETIKPVGRSIGKLTHSSPGVLFDYVLVQIQLYDNLIGPVVDSLKYLTNISYDVLGYCLVEALASADRDRFKHDGTSISLWLQSLASFCGAIFKKYNIELKGLLQYVANQLKAQKSLDLLILKEIVQKMAGIEAAEEMTSDQLDAMAGGDLLKNEAAREKFAQLEREDRNASLPAPGHRYTPKHDFNPMDCTDIIIGMARGTNYRIGDYYTRDRSTPRKDEYWGGRDSLTAALGYERDGVTTMLFRRKLAASEPTDHEIRDGNMQVIWAKGQEPGKYVHQPASGIEKAKVGVKDFYKVDELKYHGHGMQRGAATVNFFDEAKKPEFAGGVTLEDGTCGGQWRYPRNCALDNGTCEYAIQWTYKGRQDLITFVISTTNTNTWTGVGFSDDSSMSQTDAVLGWVDKNTGRAFVMDTWISGYNAPLLDPSQDVYNISGRIENGVTTLRFSRKRVTTDSKDLSFTDDHCLYMMFPVKGGIFNPINKKIRKHDAKPVVSSDRICIKSCGLEEFEEQTTPAPPRLHYDIEVKLVNLGDGFMAPTPNSPDFEVISNTISESFGPVFEKLPGYYQVRLDELRRDNEQGVIARMNLILDKNEVKGRSLKPMDTGIEAEKVLREALVTGKVGALSVDPQYLIIRAPRVNEIDVDDDYDLPSSSSDLFLGATKLYIVVGCVAALLALALLQATCTLYRSAKRRTTKERLIASNAWKDYASGANTNFAFEAFETEEKAPPPPVSSLPRPRELAGNGTTGMNGTDHVEGPNRMVGPRATYSLPRAPGARHSAPIQPGYYTQDRRDHYHRAKSLHSPAGAAAQANQPDFYFMPSQRKYSGEVVRVYVDYGSQMPK